MGAQPAIRARSSRDSLFWADNFGDAAGRVRAAMPAEAREVVEHALPTTWIPIEVDRHVIRAIVEVHGRDGARSCWRQFLHSHVESPMLKGVMSMSIRMFGLNPGSVAKIAPKAWYNVYRDFAKLELESREERRSVLWMRDIHPAVLEEADYLLCFQSVFEGLTDIFGGGEVRFDPDLAERRTRIEFSW